MIETFKEYSFEAARSLPPHEALQRNMICIAVYLQGDPDPVYGWPANFRDLDGRIAPLLRQLSGRHLNEIEGLSLPSLENIARWVFDRLSGEVPGVVRVTVSRGSPGLREGCSYGGRG